MTAMPDWGERLVSGKGIIPPPIFPNSAEHALAIFKQLRITDIAGRPTMGEACEEFVFDFVRAVFGAFARRARATRRVLP